MTIIIFVVVFAVGTLVYMKFILPKMMAKMNANQDEAEKEFAEKGTELVDEFTTNLDKFGLVKQSLQGKRLYGIYDGSLKKEIKLSEKLKEKMVSVVTLTEEVNMSLSYLVAAEDGMHYMIFDGEKCIGNEVFDYAGIAKQQLTENEYTFDYKGDSLKFRVASTLNWYPRFNVHEVVATGSGQGGLRTVNSFVREYLAYEITNNVEYRTRVLGKPKVGDMVQKKEFFLDQKIRETLVNGFREKLGVTIQK